MVETNVISNKTTVARNDKIKIHLLIAERSYPFRIKPEEEETYRMAAKRIKEKVLKIKEKVNANKDAQDILSIAILQFVKELIHKQEQHKLQPIHNEQLSRMNGDLEYYLHLHERK
jgi:cell division protein ZapA